MRANAKGVAHVAGDRRHAVAAEGRLGRLPRNGKQFKTALWGKKQGELFENSQGKHGIGPYSSHEMQF